MTKVSVIVPVHNIASYIEECIESLLAQTLREIEIIAVDDGSTDESGELLDNMARRDSRVKVIHKNQGGGVTNARNTGLKAASADYIGFVDGDDFVAAETFATLYETVVRYNADAVLNQLCTRLYTDKKLSLEGSLKEGLYTEQNGGMEKLLKGLWNYEKGDGEMFSTLWQGIYKREPFSSVQLSIPESVAYGEDNMCMYAYLTTIKTCYVMKKPLYTYRYRPGGGAEGKNDHFLSDLNERWLFLKKAFSAMPYEKDLIKRLNYRIMNDMFMCRLFCENPALFFMFPFGIIPPGARIILYGAGVVGRSYCLQLEETQYCEIAAWIDIRADELNYSGRAVEKPDVIHEREYDYILICALQNKSGLDCLAEEISGKYQVDRRKLVVYEPKSIMKFIKLD